MTRPKRNSTILDTAFRRSAGMRSLNAPLNFGNGLNLPTYEAMIQDVQAQITVYNDAVAALDALTETLTTSETNLKRFSEQMLMGVGTLYGRTSIEYGIAGGTIRKSAGRSRRNASSNSSQSAIAATVSPTSSATVSNNGKPAAVSLN
jgi:hypothetical protein